MATSDNLINFTIRLPSYVRTDAEKLARRLSSDVHEVTPAEVLRRCLIVGLLELQRESKGAAK